MEEIDQKVTVVEKSVLELHIYAGTFDLKYDLICLV